MCFAKGNGLNQLINESTSQYDLLGMISPTFQNQGTATVVIDGRKLEPGESFPYNVPGVILQNKIPIYFEEDPAKTKILYVGFVRLI